MKAVKSVEQNYKLTEQILSLLEGFRCMINDSIRIGIRENVTSMKSLSLKAYHQLSAYDVPTCYRLTALSRAAGVLRNYRRELRNRANVKIPYVAKLTLTDCYAFRIFGRLLRLHVRREEYAFIILNEHTLKSVSGHRVRSITLTASTLSIAFSKETAEIEPVGLMGIDRNLDNITVAKSDGEAKEFEFRQVIQIKQTYRGVESHFKRNDARVRRNIYGKYGTRQRHRVNQILNRVSKHVVEQAKQKKLGIVMEDIRGMAKLYRKGNGQGKDYRAKMNPWGHRGLQRQIEYKARWAGIPVIYIPPQKTSSPCAKCGSKITECAERKVWCPQCRTLEDRDVNAARNILAKGLLRFGSHGSPGEAMVGERAEVAPILKVDGGKVTQG